MTLKQYEIKIDKWAKSKFELYAVVVFAIPFLIFIKL
jgi:hypothetical protein